jgi:hypothetical protein
VITAGEFAEIQAQYPGRWQFDVRARKFYDLDRARVYAQAEADRMGEPVAVWTHGTAIYQASPHGDRG